MAFSPTQGVIISGLTGSGKSTAQRELLRSGCWSPTLVTSRQVDGAEADLVCHLPQTDLARGVLRGELVAPIIFAGDLYAWSKPDFSRLRTDPRGAVLTVRPYTALLLFAAIEGLIPVWLDVDEDERQRRLTARRASRDQNSVAAKRRLAQDNEDALYRELFKIRLPSDSTTLDRISHLLNGDFTALP